jgi:hypothetical protein
MKKVLLFTLVTFSLISLYSQNSVQSKAGIDKIIDNDFNKDYLDNYCIHFYYNDELYVLSYEGDNNPSTLLQRPLYIFKYTNNNWQYASEIIFISNTAYNYNIDFLDYPYPKSGNCIVKVLDNKCVLISMSYRESIFNRRYNYPVILLLIPQANKVFFNTILFSPNRINNRHGIEIVNINAISSIIMNDKSKIDIKFNVLDFVNSKYNINFADQMGDYMNYNK